MILLINGTTSTIWLPVYTFNEDDQILYYILGLLELFTYILTAFIVLKTCFIVGRSKNFHGNMNIIIVCCISQWFEAFFAKLMIIPYQVGFLSIGNPYQVYISWWTSDINEMIVVPNVYSVLTLYIPGMLIWHYIYSMFMAVVCVAMERTFATYYINDYEKTPRTHIGIGLTIFIHCITFPFSYLMINNQIGFILADSLCIGCVILVCPVYATLWHVNERMRKKFSVPGAYRLAKQFQVKENIRHIMLARNIVCCATFFVAIACSLLMIIVLDMVPIFLKNPLAHCVENCIFLNPLLICTVMMFSVPAWKNEFIGSLPIVRNFWKTRRLPKSINEEKRVGQETEVYFNQFKNAWV